MRVEAILKEEAPLQVYHLNLGMLLMIFSRLIISNLIFHRPIYTKLIFPRLIYTKLIFLHRLI
jgi:hypothetical protein